MRTKLLFIQDEVYNPSISTEYKVMAGSTQDGIYSPHFIICDPNPFNPIKVLNIKRELIF
jgi:hypothetical protein